MPRTIGPFDAEPRALETRDGSGRWFGYIKLRRAVGGAEILTTITFPGGAFDAPGDAAENAFSQAQALHAAGEV